MRRSRADWTAGISEIGAIESRRSDVARTGRWVTPASIAATAVLVWATGFFLVQLVSVHSGDPAFLDMLVYRAGGHAVLTGHSLYAPDFGAVNQSPKGLPFTYPPFSALVFVPLAILPANLAKIMMVGLNAAAATILLVVILVAVQNKWTRPRGWRWLIAPIPVKTGSAVLVAAVSFVLSVPVLGNFAYGQVDLMLAAAVALDILLPSVPWPRGLLVGLAAAIKLTPAVFVGYFLVTRQWRALAVSLSAAASAVALSWLVDPGDVSRYFHSTIFDPARIGGLSFASNQSMLGVFERIPALDSMRGVLWVMATALVLALAIVAMRVAQRSADSVAAMLSAAFVGLLCSPVSWGHHWVWLSATVVYFLARWAASEGTRDFFGGLAVASVTLAAPWIFLPDHNERERMWNPFEHLLGSMWALAAFSLLVLFATARTGIRGQGPPHAGRQPWTLRRAA